MIRFRGGPPLQRSDPTIAVLGVLWSVAVVLLVSSWQPGQQTFVWVLPLASTLVQAAFGAALLFRRRFPLSVAISSLVGSAAPLLLTLLSDDRSLAFSSDLQLITTATTPLTSYAAVRYSDRRGRAWVLVLATTILVARPWAPDIMVATTAAVYVALPALLGGYVAARRRLIDTLVERAEQAEAEQRLLAESARADERLRLAEEVHGLVTERIDQMLALTARLGEHARSETTRTAAAELEVTGQQANDELHTLVEVLRSGSEFPLSDHTIGGLSELSALVAESASAGVRVTLDERGDPNGTAPAVGRTAYRIVQEALTNAHKHAPGAPVQVRACYQRSELRVEVRNSAPVSVGDAPGSSGTGLLGLRQRVELVEGSLRAGPTGDGGFLVSAILPAYVPSMTGAGDTARSVDQAANRTWDDVETRRGRP